MDRVATDITGPFPTSDSGSKYILVVQDQFSKWVEAYAIKDQSAETVARVLVHEFFSRFGVPLELHSDQGSNYGSDLFKEVCKLLEIHKTRTTPYHPSGNGLVERFNQTLLNMVSAYVSDNQKDWDLYLPLLTSAYRSCAHDSSGLSPNQIMLGREVHQPISLAFGVPGKDKQSTSPVNYVYDLWNKMTEIQSYVRKHLKVAAERQKRDYDTRASCKTYEVGDLVYYLDSSRKVGLSPKLKREQWKGPFVISRKISDLLYELRWQHKTRTRVIHHDRLKPFQCDTIPDWVPITQKYVMQKNKQSKSATKCFGKNKSDDCPAVEVLEKQSPGKKTATTGFPVVQKDMSSRPQRKRKVPMKYGFD